MIQRLCACVLVCLLACIVEGHVKRVNRGSRDYVIESVDGHEYERCDIRSHKDAFKKSLNQVKCYPRDAVVKLMPAGDFSIIPDKVMVKRCHDSGCYGKNSCAPTATKQLRIAVRMVQYNVAQPTTVCSWVNVTEHIACKCGCMVKPEHCNSKQVYSDNECMCKCMDYEMKNQCLYMGMTWDEETCTCKCNTEEIQECSTGTEWVPRMCKCMKVMMMDDSYDKYSILS